MIKGHHPGTRFWAWITLSDAREFPYIIRSLWSGFGSFFSGGKWIFAGIFYIGGGEDGTKNGCRGPESGDPAGLALDSGTL